MAPTSPSGEARVGGAPRVAIAADYLTQRGGAERVVIAMADAFPDAPILTAAYAPSLTYPELQARSISTLWPDRIPPLRRDPRLAFPVLASAWNGSDLDADVAVVSSSGWAHGVRARGRKLVYCHNPARWLYQPDDYFASGALRLARPLASPLMPALRRWDRRAAATADLYLANSTSVQRRIRDVYGIEAELLHPPVMLDPRDPLEPIDGIEPGFLLTVARARGYKNSALVVDAAMRVPRARLVVVGGAPDGTPTDRVTSVSGISDGQLRWLYANAEMLLAASHEDFGLTPVEAGTFGTPVVALRAGGYLDSIEEGVTGVFFDDETPAAAAAAIIELRAAGLDRDEIARRSQRFSRAEFVRRLREHVDRLASL